jgi:RHS repeat-associated protein
VQSTVYIDGVFEHATWAEGAVQKQNNRVHVTDAQKRVAEIRLGDASADDKGPGVQYHFGDHLGSSSIVVDDTGAWVNREEFLPYGETSFGSFGKKRYRFTGKERDEESGLCYHGARYYAPWLARWVSCDPLTTGASSLYPYARNPLGLIDGDGREPRPIVLNQATPSLDPSLNSPLKQGLMRGMAMDPKTTRGPDNLLMPTLPYQHTLRKQGWTKEQIDLIYKVAESHDKLNVTAYYLGAIIGSFAAFGSLAGGEEAPMEEGALTESVVQSAETKFTFEGSELEFKSEGSLLKLQPYSNAREVRLANNLSGSQFQAAHLYPVSAGNNKDAALTVMMDRSVHGSIDKGWQADARALSASGQRQVDASWMYESVKASVQQSPLLTPLEKSAVGARLSDEMFMELGLKPTTQVRVPYSKL